MEQHSGDFSVTVRDVRQLTQPESDLLTLLWVLEGSVNLAVAEGASQPLAADGLAIVNRNRRRSPAQRRGQRRDDPHPLRQLAGPPR
ncbi:AraC family transcriptional regulator [Klebsiella pneumoniae]|uniref:AraC family transcriptional regulator n=1 Tax=Klebsiella pneumoniae TaxID=573 RepID=A0A2X3HGU1_KLEPN|nr:AraC family transcriptional regulator [Klebsiella pneumoniae]